MANIDNPQDLQQELQLLITSCNKGSMGSPRPSREKLAGRLGELADRVAAKKPSEDPAYRGKDVTKWSQRDHSKRVDALTKKSMGDLIGLQSLIKVEMDQAQKKDPKSIPALSLIQMHIDTAVKRKKKEKKATMAERVVDRVSAVPTPTEDDAKTAEMLRKKIDGAQKLLDAVYGTGNGEYNIGDFFKSDLPKARKLTDRITKNKQSLEKALYAFIRQAKTDMKRLGGR